MRLNLNIFVCAAVLTLVSCNSRFGSNGLNFPSPFSEGQGIDQPAISTKITDFFFQQNIPLTANYFQYMVALDKDQDGDLDLIVTESNAKKVSILVNDGQGVFSLDSSLTASNRVHSRVITEDLNGDGHYDITVATTGGIVNIWLNDGNNQFPQRTDVTTSNGGGPVQFISVGDINSDGKLDLVVANTTTQAGGELSVLTANSHQPLQFDLATVASGLKPYGVSVKDLNGDGADDVVFTSRLDDKLYVYKSENGSLVESSSFAASVDPQDSQLTDVIVADFNKDGNADLAWGSECVLDKMSCHPSVYDQNVYVAYGNGDLSFDTTELHSTQAFGDVRMLSDYDLNKDGYLDLISIDDMNTNPFASAGERASISVLMNDREGGFVESQNVMLVQQEDAGGNIVVPGSSYSNSFAFGDFNQDGIIDFAVDAKLNSRKLSSGVRIYFGKVKE